MRVGVTGCAGRLGRGVVRSAIDRGWEVVGIDLPAHAAPLAAASRQRADPPADHAHHEGSEAPPAPPGLLRVEADVRDYEALVQSLVGCDALVHLAAHVSPRAQPAHVVHNDNVTGSYNALCAAVELGIGHVCLASSINAIGAAFSRRPRYDYFPLDEDHPTYNEDPYSLSKWAVEEQADSIARRYEEMTISTLRIHRLVPDRSAAVDGVDQSSESLVRELWGYTTIQSCAEACLLALEAPWRGHERFYVVSPETTHREPSQVLCERHYPDTPRRVELSGHQGFYDCSKARRMLGWQHHD